METPLAGREVTGGRPYEPPSVRGWLHRLWMAASLALACFGNRRWEAIGAGVKVFIRNRSADTVRVWMQMEGFPEKLVGVVAPQDSLCRPAPYGGDWVRLRILVGATSRQSRRDLRDPLPQSVLVGDTTPPASTTLARWCSLR
ncbi:MAG TPA: hypothetical protein VMH88_11680 [Gemmatimonadales bacterium]|nr:hypothetical protein [Gemmatimonadales bacterium]